MKNNLMLLFALLTLASFGPDTFYKKEKFVLVVDAGHGGEDAGANQVNGYMEKDLTLSLAKKIKEAGLKAGLEVILTRSEDKNLSLEERANMVADQNPDLFISIHLNEMEGNKNQSGIDFYTKNNGLQATKSIEFANLLKSKLDPVNGISSHQPQPKNLFLLKNIHCPGLLVEFGFLSNENDLRFMTNPENQNLLSHKVIEAALEMNWE